MIYGGGIIAWRKNKLKSLDQGTCKLMTMNKELNPNSEVSRLYVSRKEGGRGFTRVKSCVRAEENSLAWYINSSTEEILEMVKVHRHLKVSDVVEPERFKREQTGEKLRLWHNKKLHGQFLKEME